MAIKFFAFFFPTISTFGCFWSQWPTSLAVTMRCGRLPSRSDVNIFLYGLSISWGTQFYPYVYIRMYIHTYIHTYIYIYISLSLSSSIGFGELYPSDQGGAPTTSSALQFQNALHAAVAGDGDTGIVAHVQGQNGLLFTFHLRFAKSAKSMTVSGHLRSPYGEVSKVMYPRLPSSKKKTIENCHL